jgi:hypothetical protein
VYALNVATPAGPTDFADGQPAHALVLAGSKQPSTGCAPGGDEETNTLPPATVSEPSKFPLAPTRLAGARIDRSNAPPARGFP